MDAQTQSLDMEKDMGMEYIFRDIQIRSWPAVAPWKAMRCEDNKTMGWSKDWEKEISGKPESQINPVPGSQL